ncbi:hypothetical protein Aperf_G00000068838 [Anoplocephala perfoliata]
MQYKPRDRVFAKVRGHPHWPARINIVPEGSAIPKGKHPIFFYGTHEVYNLAPKDLYPYEQWKHKYGAARKNNALFQKGLEEIENNPDVLLLGTDPHAEEFLSQFFPIKPSKNSKSQDESPKLTEDPTKESVTGTPNDTVSIDLDVLPSSKRTAKRAFRKSESSSSRRGKRKCVPRAGKANFRDEGSAKTEPMEEEGSGEPEEDAKVVDNLVGQNKPASPDGEPAMTASGRPMRKSASKFSAVRLLNSALPSAEDKPVSEDADWHPPIATPGEICRKSASTSLAGSSKSPEENTPPKASKKSKDDVKPGASDVKRPPSPLVKSDDSSSSSTEVSVRENRKRKASGDQSSRKRKRILSSPLPSRRARKTSTLHFERPRMKAANVSMTPEELKERMNNGLKELNELDTEARLHMHDRGIKKSLIRGQENIPACLQRLETLDKMVITLPLLVRCPVIVDTIRKCTRYKPSKEVKIAAFKIYNKFSKIYENATAEELKEAQAVLTENNRKRSGSNSAQAGPITVEAIFIAAEPAVPTPVTEQQQLPPEQPPEHAIEAAVESGSKSPPPPEPDPPVSAEPVQPVVQLESPTESIQMLARSPGLQTTLPPLISPPASPLLVASYRDTPLSPSAMIKSDSEGLAPSVDGEESIESDDEYQRSLLLPPPSVQDAGTGATVAAVRQAFIQHTQQQRRDLRQLFPLQRVEADTYEPQPLHSSGNMPTCTPHHVQLEEPPVRRNDPRMSPNNRRRVPIRERPRSPHALPHPLEHYQRLLNSGDPRQQAVTQQPIHPQPHFSPPSKSPSIGDLDSRIAQILGNARVDLTIRPSNPNLTQQCPQQRQQQQSHPLPPIGVLSQPPPPPHLASSQNVILSPYGSVPLPPPPLSIPPPVMMHPSLPPPFVPHGMPSMPKPPPSTIFIPTSPVPAAGSMVRPPDPQNMWPHSQKQQQQQPQQQQFNGSRSDETCKQTDV